MSILEFLKLAVEADASDVFIIAGAPVSMKREKKLVNLNDKRLLPPETQELINEIYKLAKRDMNKYLHTGDDDFSFSAAGLARFRVNAYRQRGSMAAVVRIVQFEIPDWRKIGIPSEVLNLSDVSGGLIFVTGTAGSGKSTTQACIIDQINRTRNAHIVTLEDPIEYLHRNRLSIVSQREISIDTEDYPSALRACLRQAPNVILIGEVRDYETIKTAMTAAETGHLVIATLHTGGAVNTVNRIIDAFPGEQQSKARAQLSMTLDTVVSQQLLPDTNGGLVPAFEIMHATGAIRSMIRENKIHQLDAAIASGANSGMVSMDQYILSLYQNGKITEETALSYCENAEQLKRHL